MLKSTKFQTSTFGEVDPGKAAPGEVKTIRARADLCQTKTAMNEPGDNPPKASYQWPWFAAAAALLAIVLAIVWMTFAVRKVERERDFSGPLPSSAPVR